MDEQNNNIFDKILNKMHDFGMKYDGKHPNWLYLNHEHFCRLKKSNEYVIYTDTNPKEREPKTILGMQYQIREDQEEIEVQ